MTAGRLPRATPAPRPGRVARASALALGGLILACAAAAWPAARLAHQSVLASGGSLPFPFTLAYGAVGFAVAWRRPASPLGWLLLAMATFGAVSEAASFYTVADYRVDHGGRPLGWVAVLLQPGWAPAIVLLGLAVLLFPDGRLPSRRWRWLAGLFLLAGTAWLVTAYALSIGQIAAHHIRVDAGGNLTVLDGQGASAAWWNVLQIVALTALVVSWVTSVAVQAASYRRSSGERRQQLKWLTAGAAGCLAGLLLGFLPGSHAGLAAVLPGLASWAGLLALPASMGVAILRYRLYDIDRLVSRTVAYALVTGLLVGVYAGLVLLATQVLGVRSSWAVAVSTLAAAALFNPVRRRVQRGVDRRFNRARYDADQMIAAFAARLAGAVDLETARADLAGVVTSALEPAFVRVTLARPAPPGRERPGG